MASNREKMKQLEAEIEKTRQEIDRLNKQTYELLVESGCDGE